MSETIATPDNAEQAQSMPDKFDTFEEAMTAFGDQEMNDPEEDVTDTPEEDQPEDAFDSMENEDASADAEDDLPDDESDEPDGDDPSEDIPHIEYDPSMRVTLEDGTESTLEDLVKGNLRQSDYTRKTEALAEERRELESIKSLTRTQSEEINRTYNGLVELLQNIMPPEPSLELLGQNQSEYLRQQAIRKSFNDELSAVLNNQANASNQTVAINQADAQMLAKAEDKKLVEVMPTLVDEMRMASFKEGVQKTALSFGFTEQEIGAVVDHRLLHLVHLAGVGKRSIENSKNARRRIERKSATPAETKPVSKNAPRKTSNNGKAMRRLSQSGSIGDAMMVDFS